MARVPGLDDVVDVSVGRVHSAAVTRDGALYTWGGGLHGRLGHNDTRDEPAPQQVDPAFLGDRPALAVACGLDHTLVLVDGSH